MLLLWTVIHDVNGDASVEGDIRRGIAVNREKRKQLVSVIKAVVDC